MRCLIPEGWFVKDGTEGSRGEEVWRYILPEDLGAFKP